MKGADVLFYLYNISTRFHDYSIAMAKYCSIASCAYVAIAGRVGWHKNVPIHDSAFFGEQKRDLIFAGGSQIIYGGQALAAVQDFTERIAVATINPELPKQDRTQLWPIVYKKSSAFSQYMK
jgi:predicted amidohydrolase